MCLAPVYTAAKKGDLDEFIQALERYSDEESASLAVIISTEGPCGNSLLHFIAGTENADILKALLEVIRDPQLAAQKNKRGDTPLHVVARAGSIHMAELLLNLGCTGDEPNDAGNTALHLVVKEGNLELTNLLLDRGSKAVNKINEERKCPLYLAVETGKLKILSRLLQAGDGNEVLSSWIEGMPPVLGAVMHQKIDMLREMSERKIELFDLKDARKGTPLHLAAGENYVDGVKFLVKKFASSAFKHNGEGYLPIHVACEMGHLETIKLLRQHWPNWLEPAELLTYDTWQNILHVVAKHGRASVVKYILDDPKLKKLINMKDKNGNTPLHVATEQWQPEVLLSLTRDKRVNLDQVNHKNSTALDIVDGQLKEIEGPLHQRLTRTILVSAKAPKSKDKAICWPKDLGPQRKPPEIDTLKSRAEVRMIVATLIAGVTFAAGFSVPGGYNGSEPDIGIATLLNKPMYDVFVICNSIAMYNSIIAVTILLWTQINDPHAVFRALGMTRLPLLIALATMSMAFTAGVYVTISKRAWIAVVALIIGIIAFSVILILYIALFVPLGYKCRLVQPYADYIIRAIISISRRVTEGAPGKCCYKDTAAVVQATAPHEDSFQIQVLCRDELGALPQLDAPAAIAPASPGLPATTPLASPDSPAPPSDVRPP
ncbi:hypothetical protein BT93_L0256 [Corymbia citriodora subsp. variegata]|uniref:PGG domain-containing protein n=1 Tax=Corymbia citriodora subsp. variegata TaxID=360336 RepID=A0A8T0CUH7_CORYI|nr:hypothetical protein BT93_L0256 [Corymbia citriodora subsp. variegata]